MQIESNGMVKKYNYSEVGITDGLVGWWPLNGNANDFSGNSNHGSVSGATVASGLDQLCYSFDGVDDKITITDNTVLNPTNAITVSTWIKWTTNNPNWEWLISKNSDSGATNGYALFKQPDGVNQIRFCVNGVGNGITISTFTIGTWYHIIGTATAGSSVKLYVDGTKVSETATVPNPIVSYNGYLGINSAAYYPSPNNFNGFIQDVRIYNRALSADEVNILYELGNSTTKTKISKNTAFIKGEFNELL